MQVLTYSLAIEFTNNFIIDRIAFPGIVGGIVQKAIVLNGSTLTVNGQSVPFESPGPRSD